MSYQFKLDEADPVLVDLANDIRIEMSESVHSVILRDCNFITIKDNDFTVETVNECSLDGTLLKIVLEEYIEQLNERDSIALENKVAE